MCIRDRSCVDGSSDLTLTSTVNGGTTPYTYAWTGPNGFTSSDAIPVISNITSANSGTYNLIVTDSVGCVSEIASGVIEITDQPEDPIIAPLATICDGEILELEIQSYSGTNVTYNWTFNGAAISNNSNTLIIDPATSANSGTYTVIVTVDGLSLIHISEPTRPY